jgi:ABC-type uncharacterized transport system permease subunit
VVPARESATDFVRAREFEGPGGEIVAIAPSLRDRTFLVSGANGGLGLYSSTPHRTLFEGEADVGMPTALALGARGRVALVSGTEGVARLAIRNPHPEFGLGPMARRVLYEGYPAPAFVWQSTGGTDDFEPKLSLVPLVVGTLALSPTGARSSSIRRSSRSAWASPSPRAPRWSARSSTGAFPPGSSARRACATTSAK